MKILCMLLGHKWGEINNDLCICDRCFEVRINHEAKEKHKPASTLDEIIHDDWYKAREKD